MHKWKLHAISSCKVLESDSVNSNILESDIEKKKAKYIERNNVLGQEFGFYDISTKLYLNEVYNGSWYGSNLWDLFSKPVIGLESCYN